MKSIGERIKKARLENGFSQVELAEAANVSQPTVANWETGSHTPRQPALLRLADILNTSAVWFLSGAKTDQHDASAPEQYLNTPIHHVPIVAWPQKADLKDGILELGRAKDFLAVSVVARKPFALLANDPAMAARFPIGTAIVFDAIAGPLEDNACYLFQRRGEIILRSWRKEPDRYEAHPGPSVTDPDFAAESPLPLARAILSIQRH